MTSSTVKPTNMAASTTEQTDSKHDIDKTRDGVHNGGEILMCTGQTVSDSMAAGSKDMVP